MLQPVLNISTAAVCCLFLAAELAAQGGLGAPPGSMGGGVRGGSGSRTAAPGGRIPTTPPADRGGDRSAGRMGQESSKSTPSQPSRPVGNILYPGSPAGSSPGSILSPGGSTGRSSILSPGSPGPYRPGGNVLTPGTPAVGPSPGIYSFPRNRDRFPDRHRDPKRDGNNILLYPFVYFGFPTGYAYGNGGYVDYGGSVTSSSSANYTIEGPLDQTQSQGQSRVYEVGPESEEPLYKEGSEQREPSAMDDDQAPPEQSFFLIALQGGLIYAARDHWLLGNTLHLETLQGDHYVLSLNEVDLDLSAQLNEERGLKLVLEVRPQGDPQP